MLFEKVYGLYFLGPPCKYEAIRLVPHSNFTQALSRFQLHNVVQNLYSRFCCCAAA